MLFAELAVCHRLTTVTQTGFSQGVPSITNDDELADQVAGFLQQFLEVFTELKGANFFVTGESVCPRVSLRHLTCSLGFTQYAGYCESGG